jgi:hypothetical protein
MEEYGVTRKLLKGFGRSELRRVAIVPSGATGCAECDKSVTIQLCTGYLETEDRRIQESTIPLSEANPELWNLPENRTPGLP